MKNYNSIIVRMVSKLYGSEEWRYDSMDEAFRGIEELRSDVQELDDQVERLIGVVVNPQEDE
tara:strand:- start:361 stop:546 length:186 start_codon:yes stop_codon:yes gene_type:complete